MFCPGADLHLGAQNLLDRFLISLNCTGGRNHVFFKNISGHTHVTGGYFTGEKTQWLAACFSGSDQGFVFFFPATPTPFSTNGPLERCEPSTCSKGELDGCCPLNGWLGFCGMLGWMVSNNPNKRSFGLFKLGATDKTRYCRSRFCDDLRMQVNR